MKVDGGTGEVLWSSIYSPPGDQHETAYAIAVDSQDNPIVTGRAYRTGSMDEFATIKFGAENGDILWKVFDGGPDLRDDRAWAVAIGIDDNPVVTGISLDADDSAAFLTIKYDGDTGEEMWRRRGPGAVNDVARAGWVGCDANGDVLVANRTWAADTSFDVIVQKLTSADGDTIWNTRYDGPSHGPDDLRDMRLDGAGNPLIAGGSSSDYLVLKVDGATGDVVFATTWDGPAAGYDRANCVAEGVDGRIVVSGFTTGEGTSWDVSTIGLDPLSGEERWHLEFDGAISSTDEGTVVTVSGQGDIYVGGYTYDADTGMDALAIRYTDPPVGVGLGIDRSGIAPPRLLVAPNPIRRGGSLRLTLTAPAGSDVREVLVIDGRGRVVRSLDPGDVRVVGGPGERASLGMVLPWDGRDGNGHPLASGIYFVRVMGTNGPGSVAKTVLLR